MKQTIAFLFVISILLSACAPAQVPVTAPCIDQALDFYNRSGDVIADWHTAVDNLQLSFLLTLPKKIEDIPVPACAKFYKASILQFMYLHNAGNQSWDKAFGDFLNAGMCLNMPEKDPAAPAACYEKIAKKYNP